MSGPAKDAAVLYLAIHGWGAALTCGHVGGEASYDDGACCGEPMVGVSDEDGAPLCALHVEHPEECGHRLSPESLEAIRALRADYHRKAGKEPE